MAETLIRNIEIINETGQEKGDILLRDGWIETIGSSLEVNCSQIIDGTGLCAMPGLVDLHVHLRDFEQSYKDTVEAGAHAAAAGGVTSLVAMANTRPVTDSPEQIATLLKKAEDAPVRIYPVGAVTRGMQGEKLTDFGALKAAGAAALSDDGLPVADSALLREALVQAKQLGLPLLAHCEDKSLTGKGLIHEGEISRRLGVPGVPAASEEVATAREITLSAATGAPVHICHVSTAASVEMIRVAKAHGVAVTCESAPHYFTLTDEALLSRNANFRMSPPLRTDADRRAIIEGLCDGTIDAIATDHAPHSAEEKADFLTAPNGILGLETSLSLTLTMLYHAGMLNLPALVRLMSAAPARILGVPGGRLSKGQPADLILVDINRPWTPSISDLHSKAQNCPYFGRKLTGRVVGTFCRGKQVYALDS